MAQGAKWAAIAIFMTWAGCASAAEPAGPAAVPVTTEAVRTGPVPIFLSGLGTVQAYNTVEVKAQVNGVLTALPVKEGQEVHKGDIVAEIDPRLYQATLDQANAQRQEDQAQLQSGQLDLKRYQSLALKSFAPVQQVDDQIATVDKETATVAADAAAIEIAQLNLGYCIIRAPINGHISLYQVDVGNLIEVASQTGIISITQDKPISVVFTLPESQLAQVQDALAKGPVPVLISDHDTDLVLSTGVLMAPNNTIDTSTGTISLKASFENPDDRLWPGEFVNTRVKVIVLPHAVTVPSLAVEHSPAGLFVYIVKPDAMVASVPVEVGYQYGGRSVVTEGLSGSETVVVTGQSRLAPGTKVRATDTPKAPSPAESASAVR